MIDGQKGSQRNQERKYKMVEVGKVYVTKEGNYRCIYVEDGFAYMVFDYGQAAYVWDVNTGKSLSLGKNWDLVPKKGFLEV
jgi:hypothetical protein